jgi:CCR4-NOT transcription complex subunit 4
VRRGSNTAGRLVWRCVCCFRASFGTTKYCNTYLRHMPCHSPDCLFLHEVGEEDGLTKEDVAVSHARRPHTYPSERRTS